MVTPPGKQHCLGGGICGLWLLSSYYYYYYSGVKYVQHNYLIPQFSDQDNKLQDQCFAQYKPFHAAYRHQLQVSFALLMLKLQKIHIFTIMCHAAWWLPKIVLYYKLLHFTTLFTLLPSLPTNFFLVFHENVGSRQKHKFTTCVHGGQLRSPIGENNQEG